MKVQNLEFKVLDKGFIRVVDYMGDDSSIVQAARVSYGKGTRSVSDDRSLIRYLMRKRHTSPFEQCELKLHIKLPMDCWRQFVRHRTASVNEVSTRYSIVEPENQTTAPLEWRRQSSSNKQGSEDKIENGYILSETERQLQEYAYKVYEQRIEKGVAREQARKDLLLSTYTQVYWKIDLHNLLHFLELRMDEAAQWEIRQYANIIGREIVANWCPLTWEAFLDYRLNAVTFSRLEMEWLKALLERDERKIEELNEQMSKRERLELKEKLPSLNSL